MRRNFSELTAKMSPESRARAEARTKEMMADMLLGQIRQLVGLTQEDLAKKLGTKQANVSRLESQDDMQVSTLRRLIEALGGKLEIMVRFPDGNIRVGQFGSAAHA